MRLSGHKDLLHYISELNTLVQIANSIQYAE